MNKKISIVIFSMNSLISSFICRIYIKNLVHYFFLESQASDKAATPGNILP